MIPVIHLKNGVMGSRGHLVSFFQDLSGICNELPKLPSDISIIKVIWSGTTRSGENISTALNVNRHKMRSHH